MRMRLKLAMTDKAIHPSLGSILDLKNKSLHKFSTLK